MSKQDLNYGASADDGTGDTGRDGAIKIVANFDELYAFLGGSTLSLPSTRIPYGDGSGFHTSSANFLYTETSGPRLQVGSGTGTTAGLILGQYSSNTGAIWCTTITPDANNYNIQFSSTTNNFLGSSANTFLAPNFNIQPGGTLKFQQTNTAGIGPSITAGTATTDVNALSATQTWNAAGVAFTGIKYTITDTASAAGSLAMQILGGASGTTNLMSLNKDGILATASLIQAGASVTAASGAFFYWVGKGSYIDSPVANQWRYSIGNGTENARTEINKAVTAFTDAVAKTVFTLTIPNAAHSASYLVRITGSIGAGGAIGANEASATNCYVVTLCRTAGVNATAAISAAFGAAATNVAGATTVTCTAAVAAVSGAVGASNTIDIQATITKAGGSSDNHTCVATASLLNANATGITIA